MSELHFNAYRIYDPAIVAVNDMSALGTYAVDRDETKIVIPTDPAPIMFRCRPLTRTQRRLVQSQSSDENRREMAFRYGLIAIENLPGPNGPRSWSASRAKDGDPLTDGAIESTGLGDRDLWEIGSVIYERSFLALGAEPSYLLLGSSLHVLGAMAARFHRAEQTSET